MSKGQAVWGPAENWSWDEEAGWQKLPPADGRWRTQEQVEVEWQEMLKHPPIKKQQPDWADWG